MDPKAKLCEQARDCHEDKVLAVPPTGAGESGIAHIILGTISGKKKINWKLPYYGGYVV